MEKEDESSDESDRKICLLRLKSLLERIEKGNNISREELKTSVQLSISVIKEASKTEEDTVQAAGVAGDEEDDSAMLNTVETNVVPAEVRDWLALTFSRSSTSCPVKRQRKEKPKFKSVAQAIRAGLMVDKIYRRMCSSTGFKVPSKVASHLKSVDDWSFNVLELNEISDGHSLKYVGHELLHRYDFINKFKINVTKLDQFLTRLEQGYSKHSNPYHNLTHAADVAQSSHHVIKASGLTTWFSDLEVLSSIIASLIHDYEHTGTTNTFHINTYSETALLYNDKSVLENHHLSAAFRLMQEEDLNILSNLRKDDFRELRIIVIEIVLATDMSFHFHQLKTVKNSLSMQETIENTKALSLIVHCCDISHPAKDWGMHNRWTELLMEEFFRQGDQEELLSLPVSPLCHRRNTLVAESQIGFINFIVDPSLQILGDMVDRLVYLMSKPRPSTPVANASSNATTNTKAEGGDNDESSKSKTTDAPATSTTSDTTSTTTATLITLNTDAATTTTAVTPTVPTFNRCWVACLVANKQKWKERSVNGWISPLQVMKEVQDKTENEGGASSHSATKPTPSIKFPSDEKEDEEKMEKNDAHNQTNPNNDNNDNNKPKNNDDNDHSDSNKPTNTDSDINKVHESVKTDSGSSP